MNNIVKADVKVTYDQYRQFALYHAFREGRGLKPTVIISYVITVICLVVFLLWLIIDGFDAIFFGAAVFMVLLQITKVIRIYYYIKKNYAAMSKNGARVLYLFSQDNVKVETLSAKITGQSELKYDAFTSIVESRDSFYLYISKASALIVPMSAITEGTAGMLSALLREKTGSRHIFSY